jgi:hypothetical protein
MLLMGASVPCYPKPIFSHFPAPAKLWCIVFVVVQHLLLVVRCACCDVVQVGRGALYLL